jgi:4-hydroxybenzoate polyprenyltransferase
LKSAIDFLRANRPLIAYIFFSNYFYGICAVALSIEASLQQRLPLNDITFYVFIFALTALYYTKAYITEKRTNKGNPRSDWYWENKNFIIASQVLLTVIVVVYAGFILYRHFNFILHLPLLLWALILIFPFIAGLYYGINHPILSRFRLRNIGWLKPFIIGFVWAGLVNIYPLVLYDIQHEIVYVPDIIGVLLFIKNFMFVTVLCIMFDIKDYAADHNLQLKTFVVKAGLRKTIFLILIPLSLLGLSSFIVFGVIRHFSLLKILLNVIPFLFLISVAYSLHKRKSIFYYLIVIDGLMLIKALCGITAMTFG